jgi:hypothetical protein
VKKLITLMLFLGTSFLMAVENYPDSHGHSHDQLRGQVGDEEQDGIQTYSCNLITYSNQCREYTILEEAKATFSELKDGCESMSGTFKNKVCPTENTMASCTDIVRNYHKPDVIYDNNYYLGLPSQWTKEIITRVCGDLGGEYLPN